MSTTPNIHDEDFELKHQLEAVKQSLDKSTTSAAPSHPQAKVVFLNPAEMYTVHKKLGGLSPDASIKNTDAESFPVHSQSIVLPTKGLPNGLYKEVIRARCSCQWKYYLCDWFYNFSLMLQIVFSATLTALSSKSSATNTYTTALTILTAMQTVNAGASDSMLLCICGTMTTHCSPSQTQQTRFTRLRVQPRELPHLLLHVTD